MELLTFIRLFLTSRVALIAENLLLRKQLALFQERKAKPRRTTASFRLRMVALARFFVWRDALVAIRESGHAYDWEWVRGHHGHAQNEYAHFLAMRAATEL